MKSFNLEAALNGESIVARNGDIAKFVAYISDICPKYPLLIYFSDFETVSSLTKDGKYYSGGCDHEYDLFMKEEEYYINVGISKKDQQKFVQSTLYSSLEDAELRA